MFCKVEKAVSSTHQTFLSLLCRFFSLCPHIFPYSIEGTAKSNDAAKQGSEQSWRFLRKDAQTFQQDSPFDRNLDYFFSTSFLLTSQNIAHLPPKSASKACFRAKKQKKLTILAFFFALTLACFKKSSYFCIAIGSWCNGNTTGFGSVILGSNPGDPTKCADWLRYRR